MGNFDLILVLFRRHFEFIIALLKFLWQKLTLALASLAASASAAIARWS